MKEKNNDCTNFLIQRLKDLIKLLLAVCLTVYLQFTDFYKTISTESAMNYKHFQIKGLKARAVLKLWLSFHYE